MKNFNLDTLENLFLDEAAHRSSTHHVDYSIHASGVANAAGGSKAVDITDSPIICLEAPEVVTLQEATLVKGTNDGPIICLEAPEVATPQETTLVKGTNDGPIICLEAPEVATPQETTLLKDSTDNPIVCREAPEMVEILDGGYLQANGVQAAIDDFIAATTAVSQPANIEATRQEVAFDTASVNIDDALAAAVVL